MLGIVYYLLFLLIGVIYSMLIFREKELYFKIWSGGLIGNLALMWGIIPIGFIFGFSLIAHIILLVLFIAPIIFLYVSGRIEKDFYKQLVQKPEKNPAMTNTIFIALILPITIIMWALLTNHILAPYADGAVASGQSTYGDLAMHMGIITSVADRGVFPPQHNLLDGFRLGYPFLVDTLSSSLYLLKTGLRTAILLPSYTLCLLLTMGFYFLAHKLTGKRNASVLATVFFFIGGGFGFAYFFEGAKADPASFTKIFTEYYQTPTNYNEENIRWANSICDMIIPQRTTMAGWTYFPFALYLLLDALKTKDKRIFIILGIVAGCMPMIHTHSFMGVGIISAVVFIYDLTVSHDKAKDFKLWMIYALIAVALSVPQLFLWTFSQAGMEGFVKFKFNWVNNDDPYLWFWLKNWGIAALFAAPAVMYTSKRNKIILLGGAVIFALAELVLFQPNEYDNNKLFFLSYMLILIVISEYLTMIFEKFKNVKGRYYFAVIIIIAATLSGALTIGREYHSGAIYQTFSKADIEYAEYIEDNTEKDAVFASYYNHLNPTAVLAGRQMFYGGDLWIYSHGYGKIAAERKNVLADLYNASNTDQLKQTADKYNIDYIVLSSNEQSNMTVNLSAFETLEKVYDKDNIKLYKVN